MLRRTNEDGKSLSEALRVYWWTLSGLAIFPSCLFVGMQIFRLPFAYFIPAFFGVAFLASWPWLTGKVPYSFNLVGGAVWFAGAILGICVATLVRVMLS